MEQFTFCPTDDNPDTESFLEEIESIPDSFWHYDKFRNCYILPLWNPGGQQGTVDPGLKDSFEFTEASKYCPGLIAWIKPILFSLNGRLTVLKTLPGMEMNVHLDSKKTEVGTMQYKWRMVLSGDINGLYFLDENDNPVFPNNNSKVYVMDGAHPHSIQNSNSTKITVCIGSPWHGDPLPKNLLEPVRIKTGTILDEYSV